MQLVKSNPVQLSPFNDAVAAQSLVRHAADFEKRRMLLGLHCYWIKSQIPHGEFGPWLQKNAPELCRLKDGETPQPKRHLAEAMMFCREACERAGFTISQALEKLWQFQIPTKVGICQGGEILLLADDELTPEAAQVKQQLDRGVQLQLDFESGLKQRPGTYPHKPRDPKKFLAKADTNETAQREWITHTLLFVDENSELNESKLATLHEMLFTVNALRNRLETLIRARGGKVR